jgi:hypothetical protein
LDAQSNMTTGRRVARKQCSRSGQGRRRAGSVTLPAVPTNPPSDLVVSSLSGQARPLSQWTTNFHLALFCVDPYSGASGRILETALEIGKVFRGSAARVTFLSCADAADTKVFLGPIVKDWFCMIDPDRAFVKAMGLTTLPAFAVVRQDCSLMAAAEGWSPETWQPVCDGLAEMCSWSTPKLTDLAAPAPYAGVAL